VKIGWKTKLRGGRKHVAGYDVWLSRDGGTTFPELLATGLAGSVRKLRWTVAGAATDAAVVQVVAWTDEMQRGRGASRPAAIVP
jgi:hypothetical protein